MAEYPPHTLALSLLIEQQFHEINLAITNPTFPNTPAPTPQEEHAQALAKVRYYTSKVIYFRKAQGASVDEPDGDLKTNGFWRGPSGSSSEYVRAHVDEGCAAEQLFKYVS
jgi:hypothetical protein